MTKTMLSSVKRQLQSNKMGRGAWVFQQARSVGLESISNRADENRNENQWRILSAHDNVQSYNEELLVSYVRISTVSCRTKIKKSITVLESCNKQTAAGCASLTEDGKEVDTELDKRQGATVPIVPRHLRGTDEVCLSIQDYVPLKSR